MRKNKGQFGGFLGLSFFVVVVVRVFFLLCFVRLPLPYSNHFHVIVQQSTWHEAPPKITEKKKKMGLEDSWLASD